MNPSARLLSVFIAVTMLVGCDGLGTSPDAPVTVVEAYLVAGQPMPSVRLSRTAPVNDTYDATELAIRDAQLAIDELDSADQVVESTPFVFDESTGAYVPSVGVDVAPSTKYALRATLADGSVVSSVTTVPGDFELRRINTTSAVYQSPDQVEVDVTRSAAPGRQAIFVFSVQSLDPRVESLTPLYADFLGDDEPVDLSDVLITESPPINEQNYDVNSDGTLTVRLPWIAVAFYGPNRILSSAIDDNLYDFLRSQAVQQGGSTFSPGEIPNVISHVEGGTGIFGSLAQISIEIDVLR